jgi:hypothetical protein
LVAAVWVSLRAHHLFLPHFLNNSESGLSEGTLSKSHFFGVLDDSKLKEHHAFCILKKAGYFDSNGDFEINVIKSQFKVQYDNPGNVDELVVKCVEKKNIKNCD